MSVLFFAELAVYELFDVVPFVALAAAPLRAQIRSRRALASITVALYLGGLLRRLLTLQSPHAAAVLGVVWIALYLAAYQIAFRTTVSKMLFALLIILNYASLVSIICSHIGFRLYPAELARNVYCFSYSLTILLAFAATFPFLYHWLSRKVGPLMAEQSSNGIWSFLWLVPTTFCVFFYYNVYTGGGTLYFSHSINNVVFSVVISAGSFFVLFLVLRLVEENRLLLHLQTENYRLAMQTLQYEHFTERIEQTRRAQHNLRQCMAVIQSFLKTDDRTELQRFTTDFCKTLPADTAILYCREPALNSCIVYYADLAAQRQIKFDADVQYPPNTGIARSHLIVLLGNLLENAVEACSHQTDGFRYIRLRMQPVGAMLVLTLDNSFCGTIARDNAAFLSSKHEGHGLGIASVQSIAQQYHGEARFEHRDGVFRASVLLQLNA